MMKTIDFQKEAINMLKELIEMRRSLHEIPEVGFKEFETNKLIQSYLKERIGIPFKSGLAGGTGIVAILEGAYPGPTIAIRADMDALPVEEQTGLSFSSKNKGYMHACGHDGHMAIVLGTAKLLNKYRSQLKGNVKFIFQPAEELGLGAKKMVDDGVLEDPKVDFIFGFHIWPELDKNKIGIKDGVIMSAGDRFDIEIIGKGTHGAKPYKGIDSVVISSEVISAIQTIVSREIDLLRNTAVISIGTIEGGTAFNIIPERVKMTGTIRSTNKEVQKSISQSIERIVQGITRAHGASYTYKNVNLFPHTINDKYIARTSYEILNKALGKEVVEWLQYPGIASEDFSEYLEVTPGMYFFIGAGEKGKDVDLHNPRYDFDESILTLGVEALCTLVYNLLEKGLVDKMVVKGLE